MKTIPPEQSIRDWTAIAQSVLRGEYEKATKSERESLLIGLNAVGTKECLRAVERLTPKEKKQ